MRRKVLDRFQVDISNLLAVAFSTWRRVASHPGDNGQVQRSMRPD
jgi:hypothetical protein